MASFAHVTGRSAWDPCKKGGVVVDPLTHALRLQTDQEDAATGGLRDEDRTWAEWRARRGGALWRPLGPERCDERECWKAAAAGVTRWDGLRWVPVPGLPTAPCLGLDADREGRIWVMWGEAGAPLLHRYSVLDLSPLPAISAPAGLRAFALCNDGLLGIDEQHIWWRQEGEWREIAAPKELANLAPAAIARWGDGVVVLYRGGGPCGLCLVRAGRAEGAMIDGLSAGLGLLALDDGDVLVGELVPVPDQKATVETVTLEAPPPQKARMRFGRYRRFYEDSNLKWRRTEAWSVVGFDGQALLSDAAGLPWATTPRGPRRLLKAADTFVGDEALSSDGDVIGFVETEWLDSGTTATSWHRVYLDVVLPPGTSLRLSARVLDEPEAITEKWIKLEHLDRRPGRSDRPFPTPTVIPSGDTLTRVRDPRDSVTPETLEGLLPTWPGRSLRLRIELVGTRRASPSLVGIRATWPRPSLLAWLPAVWRADEEGVETDFDSANQRPWARLERLLALFEGLLTELEGRCDTLPLLWDPAVAPADALPWLADLLGWTLDTRLGEGARRTLLLEAASLHRARGTAAGIGRLCEILAECPVQVVEAFRHRRQTGAALGVESANTHEAPGAVLGPGLVLGDGETGDPTEWYRGYAHAFSVLLFRDEDSEVHELVRSAVAEVRPAHARFELCWLGGGLRLGVGSFVGLGTALGPSEQEIGTSNLVLGEGGPPLGGWALAGWPGGGPTVLPHPASLFATFPGASPGDPRSRT